MCKSLILDSCKCTIDTLRTQVVELKAENIELKSKHMPWYLKDKYGYPIEFQQGKGRIMRIICQNIRKITG